MKPEDSLFLPCPFCGASPEITGYCKCFGHRILTIGEWNNAWAHKRIAKLEAALRDIADGNGLYVIDIAKSALEGKLDALQS